MHRIFNVKAGCRRLLKNTLFFLIILTCGFTIISAAGNPVSGYPSRGCEEEITSVLKGAVEDSGWLAATSRQEVRELLAAYYGEPLLSELSDAVWDFISVPTDWHYETRLGRITVLRQTENMAAVQAEILETDVLSGVTFISTVEYHLVKGNQAWKIVNIK
jgi:hypothetical protein